MAVRSQEKPYKAEDEGDVSNCVHNLIEAFTNGQNIFKRLREKKRKHKASKQTQTLEPVNSAELQLSNSLRRGPQDLAEKYGECYAQKGMGHRFATGDSIAHACLAEILIRLNTGLVGIITTFLYHDHNGTHSHMNLNYKSLTDLSEASRRDALTSLAQLCQRLSQSQLQIHPALRGRSPQYIESSDSNSSSSKDKKKRSSSRQGSSSRQRSSGGHVTRMPIRSSSQPQLVVVRSKSRNTTRKNSTSSGTSCPSKSSTKLASPCASPYTSPLTSPVPEYAVLDPHPIMDRSDYKSAAYARGAYALPTMHSSPSRTRNDSLDFVCPGAWPSYAQPYDYFSYMPEHVHTPVPQLPTFSSTSRKTPAPPVPKKPSSLAAGTKSPPAPIKRRSDKMTPSSYTFASDSTKLGEIPERNWAKPWDYEEAERRNRAAVPVVVPIIEEKAKGKKVSRFWRRGSGGETA